MFHSLGNHGSPWYQYWLSVSLDHFESFCHFLKKNKYETIFLDQWYQLQDEKADRNHKYLCITFDDGYLDNWVYLYPLLKKYKLNATIFVNPEFVDPSKTFRPSLENVWNDEINLHKLKGTGFLNWEEIKTLDKSDYVDIQSHSMSHNYYFCSDKIIDYYNGQDKYHWLAWIADPSRKAFWINENQKSMCFCFIIFYINYKFLIY